MLHFARWSTNKRGLASPQERTTRIEGMQTGERRSAEKGTQAQPEVPSTPFSHPAEAVCLIYMPPGLRASVLPPPPPKQTAVLVATSRLAGYRVRTDCRGTRATLRNIDKKRPLGTPNSTAVFPFDIYTRQRWHHPLRELKTRVDRPPLPRPHGSPLRGARGENRGSVLRQKVVTSLLAAAAAAEAFHQRRAARCVLRSFTQPSSS